MWNVLGLWSWRVMQVWPNWIEFPTPVGFNSSPLFCVPATKHGASTHEVEDIFWLHCREEVTFDVPTGHKLLELN